MAAGGCTHETIDCLAGLKTYLEDKPKENVCIISVPFARNIITSLERIGIIIEEITTQ